MPGPKIVKFKKESYFECLWTGVKLSSCYALPIFDKHARRLKGGSFADAACAVAWLNANTKDGRTKEKKLSDVAYDLGLSFDQALVEAPECPPVEEYDFSYRDKYDWMYKPEIHLTVDEVLQWKAQDSEEKEKEAKEEKRRLVCYDLEGEVMPTPEYKGNLYYSEKFDGLVFVENEGCLNYSLPDRTGIEGFGQAVVILSKPPKWGEETEDGTKKRKRKAGDSDSEPRKVQVISA